MGHELMDTDRDKKPNGVAVNSNGVSHGKVQACPKITVDHEEKDSKIEDPVVDSYNSDLPVVENETPEGQKLIDANNSSPQTSKSVGPRNSRGRQTVQQPFTFATDKRASSKANNGNSPSTTKSSQPNSPPIARKHTANKKHVDEEDNWSVTSSTAASIRSSKPITVGIAPKFKSAVRVERRKEFYSKLDEKHQALEKEQSQAEARAKEEQDAAVKQLRKTMVVRANPVPSFYYEPPPPKAELKKLPLTRPKSPNLNRRKSCGDAIHTLQEDVGKHCTRHRHSIGSHNSTTPNTVKIKPRTSPQAANTTRKVKDRISTPKPDIPTQS